jgi:N-acyl-D-aspartate/D-glutamate deacylase
LASALPIVIGATWLVAHPAAQQPRFDVVIANGRIVDGTGAPWFRADVGITGDRISAIGALGDAMAAVSIDATDLTVAPGFIDLWASPSSTCWWTAGREQDSAGVTTEVTGEGSSIAPVNDRLIQDASANAKHFGVAQDWRTLGDYFKRLEERSHTAINVATFVGAGGLRSYVIGKDDRPATPAELERMKQLVAEAMQQGAPASASLQSCPIGSPRPTRLSSWRKSPLALAASTSRTSVRRARASSSRSTRCLRSPSAPASPPRSGTSRRPTRRISARCRRYCGASRRRARAGST